MLNKVQHVSRQHQIRFELNLELITNEACAVEKFAEWGTGWCGPFLIQNIRRVPLQKSSDLLFILRRVERAGEVDNVGLRLAFKMRDSRIQQRFLEGDQLIEIVHGPPPLGVRPTGHDPQARTGRVQKMVCGADANAGASKADATRHGTPGSSVARALMRP